MVRVEAFGREYDDLQTAVHLLMEGYLKETKREALPVETQFEIVMFGRYVAEHWDRLVGPRIRRAASASAARQCPGRPWGRGPLLPGTSCPIWYLPSAGIIRGAFADGVLGVHREAENAVEIL